jgi:hypothetical protein
MIQQQQQQHHHHRTNTQAVRLSYVSALRDTLNSLMLNEGAEQAIAMLDEYGMSREDYFETLQELQLGGVCIS